MTSSSSLGSTRIILEFNFDRDINGAARDVQAAINAAQSLLPSGMPSRPTYRKANPSDAPIMILTLTSDTYSRGELYDFASTQLAQTIAQIDGVGDVDVGGSSLPAVRVDLNPQALFNGACRWTRCAPPSATPTCANRRGRWRTARTAGRCRPTMS